MKYLFKIFPPIFFAALFLFSCTIPAAPSVQKQPTPLPPVLGAELPALSPDIALLLEKAKNSRSYSYELDVKEPKSFTVVRKESKRKKSYTSPVKLQGDIFYNEVYLNDEKRTATAICTVGGTLCSNLYGKSFPLSYVPESTFLDPVQLVQTLDSRRTTAVMKVGTEQIESRSTLILEFTNTEAKRERWWVDSYYGIPLQQAISDGAETKEKHTFNRLHVADIKEADVNIPGQFS